jgi:hypothetical protein
MVVPPIHSDKDAGAVADKVNREVGKAAFDKEERARDGKKAMAEYEAEAVAIRAKTERLRALRLARDGTEPSSPPPDKPAGKKKSAPKKMTAASKKPKGTLSEWLHGQKLDGRR